MNVSSMHMFMLHVSPDLNLFTLWCSEITSKILNITSTYFIGSVHFRSQTLLLQQQLRAYILSSAWHSVTISITAIYIFFLQIMWNGVKKACNFKQSKFISRQRICIN